MRTIETKRLFYRQLTVLFLLQFGLLSTSGYALTGIGPLHLELQSKRKAKVLNSPASRNRLRSSRNLLQLRSGRRDLTDSVKGFLRESGLQMELTAKPRALSLGLTNGNSTTLDFEYGGFKLCQHSVKSTMTENGEPFVSGILPQIRTDQSFSEDDFGMVQDVLNSVTNELTERGIDTHNLAPVSLHKCLFVHLDGQLSPAWETIVKAAGLPYTVWASDSQVFQVESRYFGAVGLTKVYKQNPKDAELGFVTIGNLLGDGTLTSGTFEVNPGISYARANSCTHEFLYNEDDSRFAEVSAFTHATRMLSWYNEQFDYQWGSDSPRMEIGIRKIVGDTQNNALYVPPSSSTDQPRILIGEGDGIELQNLMFDADVVSHEFGHHIVFQSVTSIDGDSLVLHEGLADFFTFARTGDPCLGESICPEDSGICVSNQCLRTAKNDLKLTDPKLPPQAHLKSQFISGFLWDMYEDEKYASADLTQTVYKAIGLLSETSSFEEFLDSLFQADKGLFASKHCEIIKAAAIERGMEDLLSSDLKCPSNLSLEDAAEGTTTNEDTKYVLAINDTADANSIALTDNCAALSKSKKRKENADWYSCGQVGSLPNSLNLNQLLAWFILISGPFLGLLLRRKS